VERPELLLAQPTILRIVDVVNMINICRNGGLYEN